jgi:class 3 adenylate cyclase/tetratricopeptide (TPR) repeat protein
VNVPQERPDEVLSAALAAVQAGAWADALRLAGSLLVHDPLYTGAFEVISLARRGLESSRGDIAERRQMTILFADIAGSTALLTRLGEEGFRELMLQVHQAAAKAMSNFGGRISQYLGDGILAYFSYPEAHEDDAQRAVYAGLDLLDRIQTASSAMSAHFGVAPVLRLGIDTGRVVVGPAGAGQWTTVDSVFGDPPHIAARLQGMASANSILISDATRQLVQDQFVLESLGEKQLTGFSQPIGVHRVVRSGDGPRLEASGRTMVDREIEAAELERLWDEVSSGNGRELLIVGEAGVGKTRLTEHLANVVIATGGRLVSVHCSDIFKHSPFHPIASALRRLLVGSPRTPLEEEELRTILVKGGVPEEVVARGLTPLSIVLGIRKGADILPDQLRAATFEVLLDLVGRLAEVNPLLIAVEDLHAADASTARLLDLIREKRPARLLLVATSRPTETTDPGWPRTLRLGPLSDEFAEALVRRSAPALDDADVKKVVEGSAGLPLFLIDMAHGLASGTSLSIPSATTALLTHRLGQLDDDSRAIIRDLSVLGTAAGSYSALAAVSELSTERLERALARLLHEGLVLASPDSEGGVFQFRHPLYREVAYDGQLRNARERRHSRCADALIAAGAPPAPPPLPELIANHLLLGGRTAESIVWWQRAGERASTAAAHAEAVAHYERGLQALSSLERTAELTQLELILQLSYGASGSAIYGYQDARVMRAYTRASELGAAAADAAILLPALWGIWSYYVVRGDHDRARAMMDRCLILSDASPGAQGAVAAISGVQYTYLGRWNEAEQELQLATRASGPFSEFPPQHPAWASRVLLAVVKWVRGDTVGAQREVEESLAGAGALNGRQAEFTRAYTYCFAAWYAQLTDNAGQALSWAQAAIAIAQRHNFEIWVAAGALHAAGALTELGDFATGLPMFERALQGWTLAGAQLMLPYFFGRYGHALVRAGRADEGLRAIDRALSVAAANGEVFYDAELRRLRAEALTAVGAPRDSILGELEAAVRIAADQNALAFRQRAEKTASESTS